MKRNHIITIQRLENDRRWAEVTKLHAGVNKSSGKEYLQGGAVQAQMQLVLDLRYSALINEMRLNTQRYRITYNGGIYKIVDFDDYMERHRSVRLLGVSYVGV